MLLREIIVEGLNRYKPMFGPYYEDGNIPSDVIAKMNDIERIMQRQDRVIWMMRWYRFHLRGFETLPNDATPEQAKSYQSRMNKLVKDVGATSLEQAQDASQTAMKLMSDFEHWFSLPVARIKSFVFERQSPQVILETLRDMEDEWIETRERTVEMGEYDDAEKIIDFGNGWAWFNLNRSHCGKEGEAMGHCGNSAAYKTDDTVLSLREHVYENLWSPHLTFILHGDGFLGEMKGRANEKPVEKYHAMIYKLLQHDIVQGITGGGYMAENNFKINDLQNDEIKALKAAKWGFCSYWELEKSGRKEEAKKMVETRASDHNVSINYDADDAIITKYKSIDAFIDREIWNWDTVFDNIERELGDYAVFSAFKNDYYHESLKEHVYDMKEYINDIFIRFNDDGTVDIGMNLDEFMRVTDPDEDEDEYGSSSRDLDEEHEGGNRSFRDIHQFLDDIDEGIMEIFLEQAPSNDSLIELIRDKYEDKDVKRYSFGSPTVRDRRQQEFDFDQK